MAEQHEGRSSAPDPCPFHGVRMRSGGSWVSEVRIPASRKKIWLGSYPAPEQAARAYDVASLLLCRPFPLNFSDSPSLLSRCRPHLPAASSPSARRFIQATAILAARLAPGCASTNSFHPTHENGSSSCATPDCDLRPVSTSAYLQEDCSWLQEVCGLLAPEEPATTNGVASTSNLCALTTLSMDHGVLDAAAISLSFDAVESSSSATAGEEVQEEVVFRKSLEDQEYEEAFLEMIAVDGFTATSATVTTRHDVEA